MVCRGGLLVDHLGFVRAPATSSRLREHVRPLVEAGKVSVVQRHGSKRWVLSNAGRRRLQRAQRAGEDLGLPEAPQHRVWRVERARASDEID